MKILITGSSGYIGKRAHFYLENEMHFDVFRAVRDDVFLNHDPNVLKINWDSEESLFEICKGIDCIVHLAGLNEIQCSFSSEDALLVNGLNTLKLINASVNVGVKRFIYISTAHVYGSSMKGVVSEKTQERPLNHYAITHKIAEDYVVEANAKKKLEGVVMRLSNVIGRPQTPDVDRWTLLANQICKEVVELNSITLKSSGEQVRNFISMQDTLRAIAYFIEIGSNCIGDGIFNVGSKENIKIIELAELIALRSKKLLNKTPLITKKITGESEIEDFCYSIDKLLSIGFKFESNVQNAIDETLLFSNRYFRSRI